MWNAQAKSYVESDRLVILGVVQEQHAERTRLYAQWKEFDWPIVQDPLTKLNLAAVPIAVLIDEHGIVRRMNARPTHLSEFMTTDFEGTRSIEKPKTTQDRVDKLRRMVDDADAAVLWRSPEKKDSRLDIAIQKFERALKEYPDVSKLKFRLGVAYRMRYDSPHRQPNDFDQAVKFWSQALQENPNQYIWRRRIQQYGPRQIKPYPFYDWVDQAISDIRQRGETVKALSVPLTGAEIARPSRKIEFEDTPAVHPDSQNRITADNDLVEVHATVVPAKVKPGQAVRVHLSLVPKRGNWNNEADPLRIWIDRDSSGKPATRMIVAENPEADQSQETRKVEFEFATNKSTTCSITGFALFHACLPESGQCVFRRRDFKIEVPLFTK